MNDQEFNEYINALEKHYQNLEDFWDFQDKAPQDCYIFPDKIISLQKEILMEIGYRTLRQK